jgi:CHASE2 domain-containing sensor protein
MKKPRQTKGSVNSSYREPRAGGRGAVWDIGAYVAKGLILMVVLLLAKWGFEQTSASELIEESFYDLLQLRLSSKLDVKSLEVIVVDITDMKMDRHPFNRKYDYTSRDELRELIQKIAIEQPKAIGLDTDFTPYANQLGQDIEFLDFCLSLKRPGSNISRLPVYVGLHEAVLLGPELCLAEPRFTTLAAFIGFPNVKEIESRKHIVEWLKINYQNEAGFEKQWYCPSLAAAVTQRPIKPPSPWISWITKDMKLERERDGYIGKEFVIDYSPLEALENNTVPLHDLESYLNKNYFRDKYVLIGRGKLSQDTGDKYPIPGRRGNSHAGVYVHGCAAYTLLRRPLLELSPHGRLLLDIGLGLFVILAVASIRYRYRRQASRVAHHRLEAFFTFLTVLIVIGVGFFMVNVTRLMWDDFAIVAGSLLLHQSIDRKTEGLFGGAWRFLVFKPRERSSKDQDNDHSIQRSAKE